MCERRAPAPLCGTTAPRVDQGTLCVSTTHRPGPAQPRQRSIVENDAFDLCVAASALGFITTVTQQVVEQTFRAMRNVIVHRVTTLTQFLAVVEQYEAGVLLGSPQERERFMEHHRRNLTRYSITGQTIFDPVMGERRIVIVGEYALLSAQEFVERHERAHVGLHSLGVPGVQHHPILDTLELGAARTPHLGISHGQSD